MKIQDIRKLKNEELSKKLVEMNSELIILQGQAKTGTPPKSPGQIKKLKRTIAKIHTLNNQKQSKEEN